MHLLSRKGCESISVKCSTQVSRDTIVGIVSFDGFASKVMHHTLKEDIVPFYVFEKQKY